MSAGDGGKPSVLISDRQTRPIDEPGLRELAERTLLAEGKAASELSVSFVEEEEIADLHVRYMGEEGPTDVLSFPRRTTTRVWRSSATWSLHRP